MSLLSADPPENSFSDVPRALNPYVREPEASVGLFSVSPQWRMRTPWVYNEGCSLERLTLLLYPAGLRTGEQSLLQGCFRQRRKPWWRSRPRCPWGSSRHPFACSWTAPLQELGCFVLDSETNCMHWRALGYQSRTAEKRIPSKELKPDLATSKYKSWFKAASSEKRLSKDAKPMHHPPVPCRF